MTNYDSLSDEEMLMLAKGIDNPLIQSMARALENVMQITEERKRNEYRRHASMVDTANTNEVI